MKKLVETNETQEELKNIIIKVLDKGSNYAIKSMPVGDKVKELLYNVKSCIGEKDFSKMVSTAISCSIREGLENIGVEEKDISRIDQMLKVSLKGGLTSALNLGIDIFSHVKKYGNIFGEYIEDYFKSLKGFVTSSEFQNKLNSSVSKKLEKVKEFDTICDEWYEAYNNLDVEKANEIAQTLRKLKGDVSFDVNSVTKQAIIQNMNDMFSFRGEKLSRVQTEIAEDVEIGI